ncbi:MAG: cyclomaltodextrinase N-terminal domain-containing protein [Segetibacter sp.]
MYTTQEPSELNRKINLQYELSESFSSSFFFVLSFYLQAQQPEVYPTHWWAGMKNPKLQLMIHSQNIGNGIGDVTINYPGVKLEKVHKAESINYLFADVNITSQAKPGSFRINIKTQGKPVVINYELKKRREGKGIKFAQESHLLILFIY